MVLKLHPLQFCFELFVSHWRTQCESKCFETELRFVSREDFHCCFLLRSSELCATAALIFIAHAQSQSPSSPPDSSKRTWLGCGTVSESVSIILGPYQKNRWRGNDKFPPLECTIFVCFLFTVANWVVVIICFGMSVEAHRVCNEIRITVFSILFCEMSGGNYLRWDVSRSA